MRYQVSIDCAASPEKVFPFVAEPQPRREWMQKGFGSRYTVVTTEFPNGFDEAHPVGTKFVDVMGKTYHQGQSRLHGEIIRYARPTLFEFRSEVPFGTTWNPKKESPTRSVTLVTFELEPTGSGGTRLMWTMVDETVQSFGLLNPLFTFLLQGYMKYALKFLKTMAEKA